MRLGTAIAAGCLLALGVSPARAWDVRFHGDTGGGFAFGVALHPSGDVVAGGTISNLGTNADAAVVRLDAATGEERWRTVMDGSFVDNPLVGVLADHAPTIVALKPGIVEYIDAANQTHFVSISGGFLEVSGGGAIVLASTAEKASDIDLSRAEKALEEARRALRGEVSGVTTEQATAELERAMVRIKAAKRN